jgi:hypothetical protein
MGNGKIKNSKEKLAELKQAAEPLMKYLAENYHPHTSTVVTSTSVELLEGVMSVRNIYDFIDPDA